MFVVSSTLWLNFIQVHCIHRSSMRNWVEQIIQIDILKFVRLVIKGRIFGIVLIIGLNADHTRSRYYRARGSTGRTWSRLGSDGLWASTWWVDTNVTVDG